MKLPLLLGRNLATACFFVLSPLATPGCSGNPITVGYDSHDASVGGTAGTSPGQGGTGTNTGGTTSRLSGNSGGLTSVAVGGSSAATSLGGTTATGGATTALGGAFSTGGATAVGTAVYCPSTAPAQGDPCSSNTPAECTYGDHPSIQCRTIARCTSSGGWTLTEPDPTLCSAAGCPTDASGQCTGDGICYPASGTHAGQSCRCLTGGAQTCNPGYNPPAGCPALAPNAGTPCSLPKGTVCQGGCGTVIQCDGTAWIWTITLC